MNQNIMKPEFAPLYENTPAFSMKIGGTVYDVTTHWNTEGSNSRSCCCRTTHWKQTSEHSKMKLPLLCPVVGKEKYFNDNSNQIKRAD